MHDPDDLKRIGRGERAEERLRSIFWNPDTVHLSLDSLRENLSSDDPDELLGALRGTLSLFELFEVWDVHLDELYRKDDLDTELDEDLDEDLDFSIPDEICRMIYDSADMSTDTAELKIAEAVASQGATDRHMDLHRSFCEAFSRYEYKYGLIERLFEIMRYTSDECTQQAAALLLCRTVESSSLKYEDYLITRTNLISLISVVTVAPITRQMNEIIGICERRAEWLCPDEDEESVSSL